MRTLVFTTIQSTPHNFALSHRDPSQPPLLALVASLQDDDDGEIRRMTHMVRLDDGVQVDPAITEREGLTTTMMEVDGLPIDDVVAEFRDMMEGVEWIASYGVDHHAKVAAVAADMASVVLPQTATMDLMKRSTVPCKLPSRTAGVFKMPKMIEAYEFFAGCPLSLSFDGEAQSILAQHLDARLEIFHGLKRIERGELAKAAGFKSAPGGARGEWES